MEVPEIYEGIVEIKEAVRDPSGRAKIAVTSNDKDVDPVGACVGMKGMRVQAVVQELRGEKIDIIQWTNDQELFVRNALSPAKVNRVHVDNTEKTMQVIVPDDQLSLAIGKRGQNVRLAAKLTHWKIDIKSESEAESDIGRQEARRRAEMAFHSPLRTATETTMTEQAEREVESLSAEEESKNDSAGRSGAVPDEQVEALYPQSAKEGEFSPELSIETSTERTDL
jgi:N utilization substance protein A